MLLALPLAVAGSADDPRELEWDELMPEDWRPFDPYRDLDESQLDQLYVHGSDSSTSAIFAKLANNDLALPASRCCDKLRKSSAESGQGPSSVAKQA